MVASKKGPEIQKDLDFGSNADQGIFSYAQANSADDTDGMAQACVYKVPRIICCLATPDSSALPLSS